MSIQIKTEKEVWWASTKEYDLEVNGENVSVRIAETPKETEFFEWNETTGWEPADIDSGLMKEVYDAWSNGEIE